jgi:hypothetical protein
MILAPHNGKTVIIVVFHGDAMQRIEQHDPAIVEGTLLTRLRGDGQSLGDMANLKLTDLMICYEPDQAAFEAKCRELGSAAAILQWLGRGWEDRPAERDTVIKVSTINLGSGK